MSTRWLLTGSNPRPCRFELGGRTLTIETGRLAKQAAGAALVTYGETVVLVTATHADPRPGIDFFPLTVDFVEKTSAAGKIPGGFFKREGRLSDREVLVSRFIDRSIRPLFPDGYRDETQIIATVLSADGENTPDIPAFIGASAALDALGDPVPRPDRRGARRPHRRAVRRQPDAASSWPRATSTSSSRAAAARS